MTELGCSLEPHMSNQLDSLPKRWVWIDIHSNAVLLRFQRSCQSNLRTLREAYQVSNQAVWQLLSPLREYKHSPLNPKVRRICKSFSTGFTTFSRADSARDEAMTMGYIGSSLKTIRGRGKPWLQGGVRQRFSEQRKHRSVTALGSCQRGRWMLSLHKLATRGAVKRFVWY